MLWTTDEEIGSKTSRALIEAEASKSDAVLVFEPSLPGGALKTSRKGVGQFEMIARGVSAHAGLDPGKGVSAVRELARQIVAIDDLQDPAHGVTLTVGVVSGGTRANVVPAEARATIDARAITRADADRVQRDDAVAAAVSSRRDSWKCSGGFDRPPLERTAAVERLFEAAKSVAAEIGIDAEGGQCRRRIRRQLHGGARRADARRIWRDRRRRACASRARRDRRAGAEGRGDRRSAGETDRLTGLGDALPCQPCWPVRPLARWPAP